MWNVQFGVLIVWLGGLEFSGCLVECRISGLGFRTRSEGSGFI